MLRNGAFVNRGLTTDEDDLDDDEDLDDEELELELGLSSRQSKMAKAASHMSISSRATHLRNGGGVSYRHEAPMLNDKYFPRDQLPISMVNGFSNGKSGGIDYDGFKFPHLQLRNVTFDRRRGGGTGGVGGERVLDGITMEARGGELVAVMATRGKLYLKLNSCTVSFSFHNLIRSTISVITHAHIFHKKRQKKSCY